MSLINRTSDEPSSFRDPAGQVFYYQDEIYRAIYLAGKEDYEYVKKTKLLDDLEAKGKTTPAKEIINSEISRLCVKEPVYLLQHPRIPFISYPYEWTFPALKSAALLHLDIHINALRHDVTLTDASAYNIQFDGARPVFIDTLSFIRYTPGEFWLAHRQFCEQFLHPLLLQAKLNIPHQFWYRGSQEGINVHDMNNLLPFWSKFNWNIFTQIVLQDKLQSSADNLDLDSIAKRTQQKKLPKVALIRLLNGLANWIKKLETASSANSQWNKYARDNSYQSDEADKKKSFIGKFIKLTACKKVWDVGCNSGDYTVVCLDSGAEYVVGFDADFVVCGSAFRRAEAENLRFLPLYMDLVNPSPDQGWAGAERKSLSRRANADGMIVLALIHHLAIGRNIPLDKIIHWLLSLAPKGVIEFVPKEDPMVRKLLQLRKDIFPDYTVQSFTSMLQSKARIVASETTTSTGRILFWYEI